MLLGEIKRSPIAGIPVLPKFSLSAFPKGRIRSIVPSTPTVKLYSKLCFSPLGGCQRRFKYFLTSDICRSELSTLLLPVAILGLLPGLFLRLVIKSEVLAEVFVAELFVEVFSEALVLVAPIRA